MPPKPVEIKGECPVCGRTFTVAIEGARGRPRTYDTEECRTIGSVLGGTLAGDTTSKQNEALQRAIYSVSKFATPKGWAEIRSQILSMANVRAVNRGVPLTPAQRAARAARAARAKKG